jgi:hypothetical protein
LNSLEMRFRTIVRHVFAILLPESCVLSAALQSRRALTMATDDERMDHAEEFVRLAGLTDDLTVRDQLIDFARGWMAAEQRERRSEDDACVVVPLRPRHR